jgi:hypothetical protein
MQGIVVFSFALRQEDQEPNPCNIRLARVVEHISSNANDGVAIVSQWEVSRQLRTDGYELCHSVELRDDGTYLDSEAVWNDAKAVFTKLGITEVIPVAQPFLQLRKVKQMIAADSFTVVDMSIGHIGFDKLSTQPWTRSRMRLLIYAIKQVLTGARGHNGKQTSA